MSPVPAQRGDEHTPGNNAVPSIVIDIFREGLSEVKDAVREVSANVNQLRGETVSRHDYERFLDRYHIEWAAGQQKHDADIKAICDEHESDIAEIKAEAKERASQARTFRMWLIGISATVGLGVAGLIEQYIQHLHP